MPDKLKVSYIVRPGQAESGEEDVASRSEPVTNLPFESPAEVNTSRSNEPPPKDNESPGEPVEPGVTIRTNQSPTTQ
ncbi:hypothetical protein B9Z55_027863 [Caenorhabditis nigoni]|uniref:Uncharacterized protein n=1 Tax=Caenorhabditis nigoni TaxID=1611254 RepID=A0A2G5SEB3_9PELO|nr:hypothetical protein B9Z55_027863 [Caenorhabditis nigoni]